MQGIPNSNGGQSYSFDVLVSKDNSTWEKVAEARSVDANSDGYVYTIDDVEARYIKIVGVDDCVLSINEVLAYGEEVGNIALYKPVTSSADLGNYEHRKINDGNRASYWSAGKYKYYPWAIVDLEAVYDIGSINIM